MPKKKHLLAKELTNLALARKKKSTPTIFDGENRDFKDVIRLIILTYLLERSKELPTRVFTLLGRECSDLFLWLTNELNIESCVSVEMYKGEFNVQKKNIKAKFKKFAKKIHPYFCTIKAYFAGTHLTENKKTKTYKKIFQRFFDFLFFDYIGCCDKKMLGDIQTLCGNQDEIHSVLKERGSIIFCTTTSGRYQNSEDRQHLQELAANYDYLSPEIDESSETSKEKRPLYIDHIEAYGTHYAISQKFHAIGVRAKQVEAIYYRDGNEGTRMFFSMWELTKIEGYELYNAKNPTILANCDLLPPLTPVYLGLRNRRNHPQSLEWISKMKENNVITFRNDEYSQIDKAHKRLKVSNPKAYKPIDALLRRLGHSKDPTLLEISDTKSRGLIPLPIDKECRLALIESGKIGKPNPKRKEEWGKMAVAITNCLQSHKGPVCQSTLIKAVLDAYPEYHALQSIRAGKLNQSQLTNNMAWVKAALKKGGYTTSKKDCVAGEILKLTEKGRKTNLNRAFKNSWSEHFDLIKKGQL